MGSRTRNGDNNRQQGQGAQRLSAPAQTTHDRMRDQLARDVEAFLARGGEIQHLDPHMRSSLADVDGDQDQDNY